MIEAGLKIVTEEIRRAFDIGGSVTYIEIPIGVAGIPGWEFTWYCRRTDMYFRLALDQEYSSGGLRNYVRAECARLVSEAGRKATPGPRCDFCGQRYESHRATVNHDDLPGKVFCSPECCQGLLCAKCSTGKVRNDADTCDVCPKCEPEDCQATHRARSRDAATREDAGAAPSDAGKITPFTEPDFSFASEYYCACMGCGHVAFSPDTHRGGTWHAEDGVARLMGCQPRCSNGQSRFNVGAWVEAGLRKLCEVRYTEFLTAGVQNDDVLIVGEGHPIEFQDNPMPPINHDFTIRSVPAVDNLMPGETTLRAGHPDNRESSGKDEDAAVNDWFDRYDGPPPPDLCKQLSPRWRMVCDMSRAGYSRTEGVNRTKRIGDACSSHFLSWAFVATGCKTGGDRER